jgi:hypothetical protein
MSVLVRLYPRAWRDRYESEFLALLEARPPSPTDRFDIVRGALDARLHPQVRRGPEDAITNERAADLVIARRLGFGAILGGAIWVATWFIHINGPLISDGYGTYHDGAAAVPFYFLAIGLLIGGLVGELIFLPGTARLARVGAVVAIPFLILWSVAPWYLPEYLVAVIAMLTLGVGAVWAKAWSAVTGTVVIGALVAMTLTVILAFGGLISLPQELGSVLVALFGAMVWLGIGGSLVSGSAPVRIRPA